MVLKEPLQLKAVLASTPAASYFHQMAAINVFLPACPNITAPV
jgi:hypothetical protein